MGFEKLWNSLKWWWWWWTYLFSLSWFTHKLTCTCKQVTRCHLWRIQLTYGANHTLEKLSCLGESHICPVFRSGCCGVIHSLQIFPFQTVCTQHSSVNILSLVCVPCSCLLLVTDSLLVMVKKSLPTFLSVPSLLSFCSLFLSCSYMLALSLIS